MRNNRNPLTIVTLCLALTACNNTGIKPDRHSEPARIESAHSVYIEGGVLKVLSDNEQNILFVYIRPEVTNSLVPRGGGGATLDDPWRFRTQVAWIDPDLADWQTRKALRKEFGFEFDSRQMTLQIDKGTYSVRKGQFIVITLNAQWQASQVQSGLEALRLFDLTEQQQANLLNVAGQHYSRL